MGIKNNTRNTVGTTCDEVRSDAWVFREYSEVREFREFRE